MATYVLDTNTVSHVLRRDDRVMSRLERAVSENAAMILCPVVYYEVQRGLVKKASSRLLGEFTRLATYVRWEDVRRADWDKAAELWVLAVQAGAPHNDADVIIAAYALRRGAVLVTDNESHFGHFGVRIENWCAG